MDYDVLAQQNVAGRGDNSGGGYELKQSIDDSSAGKLFVGGIAWETNEDAFRKYFSRFGEITDAVIMMDKVSGRPRGFGFVTFADPEVANKVLEEGHVIDGRTVEVKRTVPKEDSQVRGASKTKKIFVGGLPLSLTEDELKEYFSSYGYVLEHQIMLDRETGRSRGFGFVTFDSEDAVEKVLNNGRMHEISGKQVEIKRAEPKRAGAEQGNESRQHRGGSSSKSYSGFGGSEGGFGGGYGGRMGRGYGGYGGHGGHDGVGGYGGYGNLGGSYGGAAAGLYSGYGGYGYGYGFTGPMYGGAGYGGTGYGAPGSYGGPTGYAGGRGYTSGDGSWYGGGGAKGSVSGNAKGYGTGGSTGGAKAYGNGGGASSGRFHPYQK